MERIIGHAFEIAAQLTKDSIVVADRDATIIYVNDAACETSGYARDELIGRHCRIFKSGTMESEYYRELWETIIRGEEWSGELFNKTKTGQLYWEFCRIVPFFVNNEMYFVAVKELTTPDAAVEERLLQQYFRLEKLKSFLPPPCEDD